MNANSKYTNESLGDLKVIADFLPSSDELAFNEKGVKVTLVLSKKASIFLRLRQLKITSSIKE